MNSHRRLVLNVRGNYSEIVVDRTEEFEAVLLPQIATGAGVSNDRIKDVLIMPGNYVLNDCIIVIHPQCLHHGICIFFELHGQLCHTCKTCVLWALPV